MTLIDQLTVSLPDRPGGLAEMCQRLGEWGVQIHALMIAETTDFDIVRIICDWPRETSRRLVDLGYNATTIKVVALEIENVPGALGRLLDRLSSADLHVDYVYTCSLAGRVVDVVKVSGEPLAVKLDECGLDLLSPCDLYRVDDEG